MDAQDGKLAQYGVRPAVFGVCCQGAHTSRSRQARIADSDGRPMPKITSLTRFKVPLGGQEVELQVCGMHPLRVRIREKSRVTIFDIYPWTAQRWGDAMRSWGDAQPTSTAPGADKAD